MREIRTLQGDSLDLIAYREYGQVFGYTEKLMELNPELLHLDIFDAGTLVRLPDLKPEPLQKARRYGD